MIVLWILLGILALLFLLSMLKTSFVLEYRENVTLTLSVLFLNFRLYPAKEKKVRLSDYSKKKKRKKKKVQAKQPSSEAKPEEKGILDRLKNIRELLSVLFEKTLGHLSVRAARIRILVATGDAATTAVLFGAVNSAVVLILELLDRFVGLKTERRDEIEVRPDFLADKTAADIRLEFSLRVWHILDILLYSFITYIKSKKQKERS